MLFDRGHGMSDPRWSMTEPGLYIEATISGRPVRIYNNSAIEPFGEASSGEILIVPPGAAPSPMPVAIDRQGGIRSVPQRILQPLPSPPARPRR